MLKIEAFKFHRLTPRLVDTKHPSYKISKKALDEAYLEEDVKNIAITGIYGSGKSSFLKTYFNKKIEFKKGNIINVAIADFENNGDSSNKIKIAERQVINQILYQIPSHKIPLSKFRVKDKRKWWQVLFFAACLCMFAIGLYSLFNRDLLDYFYSDLIQVEKVILWSNSSILIFLLISLSIAAVWLSRRISLKFTRFNFKGAESELMDYDAAEVLDLEAQEIVYLILASDVNTIIFEDLDRFKNISIFIRLREINSLVNAKSSEIVRFIYVIRDDLFESKDRTKFFDLMIPIIPAVTSYNSRGKVLEIFSDIEDDKLKLNPKILEQISIYIDDMRLLYSIRNEYEIYSKSIETDVYANELFALIVLKNVFPKEFEDLEYDKGYLYEVLNKRDTLIVKYEESFKEKITEREELKNQLITRFSDFLSVNIPKGYNFNVNESTGKLMYNWYRNKEASRLIYYGSTGKNYTFNTFIEELVKRDSSLKERLEQINYENLDLKIKSLDNEIDKLNEELGRRHTAKTSELLSELNEEGLSKYFYESKEEYKQVINNHYYSLIRFLLLSGLVDENYWRYKGYFHKGSLGKNDNTFINRVLSGKEIKNDFKLNNPETVTEYFEEKDYLRKDIVNYDLMDELIEKQKGKEIIDIFSVIVSTNDIEAIEYINGYDYDKLKNLVDILLKIGFNSFYEVFNAGSISSDLKLKFAGIACEYKNIESNTDFNKYMANNSKIMELDFFEDKEAILEGLDRIKIKFNDVSDLEISSNITKILIKKRLFAINLENVINIIYRSGITTNKSKSDILSRFFKYLDSKSLFELKKYVEENLDELINEYIVKIKNSDVYAFSGEKVFKSILNSDLETETKRKFIGIEKSIISDINYVEDDKLLIELFNNNLVNYNQNNLNNYYERCGEVSPIMNFINDNYKVEFSLSQEMYKDLLNCVETEINLFKSISEEVSSQIDLNNSDLNLEKYMILLSNNLIKFNKQNLVTLLDTNDDNLIVKYFAVLSKEIASEEALLLIMDSDIFEELSEVVVENVLNMNVLEDSDSIKLIDQYDKKISLFKINNAGNQVRKHVLENYFLPSDYQKIIEGFKEFDLWEEIISKINLESNAWSELISNKMSEEFLDKLIRDENLKETLKIELLKKIIEDRTHMYKWKEWIKSIGSISRISKVFENGRPKVENEAEDRVARTLEKTEVVTIGKDNRLNFRPTKFEELHHLKSKSY